MIKALASSVNDDRSRFVVQHQLKPAEAVELGDIRIAGLAGGKGYGAIWVIDDDDNDAVAVQRGFLLALELDGHAVDVRYGGMQGQVVTVLLRGITGEAGVVVDVDQIAADGAVGDGHVILKIADHLAQQVGCDADFSVDSQGSQRVVGYGIVLRDVQQNAQLIRDCNLSWALVAAMSSLTEASSWFRSA